MTKRRTKAKTPPGDRFDLEKFFETTAKGRTISTHPKKQIIFTQGDAADEVIYIKKGKVKVTVVSKHGKEAVVALLGVDEFLGDGCLIGHPKRLATANRNDGMRLHARGEGRDPAGPSRRARIFPDVHLAYSGEERPG